MTGGALPDGGLPEAPADPERAGDAPPEPPTGESLARLLEALLADVDAVGTVYALRARLVEGSSESTAEQLVGAIENEVSVVGTTLDSGFDPADPVIDVLVETEHDHGTVATSLARVDPVAGVVVGDVTGGAEELLGDDGADDPAGDDQDAHDVFNEIKQDVSQLGYGDVVDELEDVSLPGGPDPEEEVDLEEEADIALDADQGTIDLEADDGGTRADDLEPDRETIDLEDGGADDAESSEAAGSAGAAGADEAAVDPADESAIEDAIEAVDLEAGDADEGAEAPTAEAADASGGTGEAATGDGAAAEGTPEESSGDASEPAEGASVEALDDAGEASPGADPATGEPGGTSSGEVSAESSGDPGGAAPTDDTPAGEPAGEEDATGSQPPEPAAPDRRSRGTASTADGGEPAAPAVGDMDAFVGELAAAMESGEVRPERREALREALGVEGSGTGALDARVEHLQKRVDDLAAYTEAWESFLNEQGSGREFVESAREDLAEMEARIEDLEDEGAAEEVRSQLADLRERVEAAAAEDEVARLDTRIDDVESRVVGRIEDVEAAIEAFKEQLRKLVKWREHINDVVDSDR